MKRFISVLMSVCLMLLCAIASPARVWAEEVEEPVMILETAGTLEGSGDWAIKIYDNREMTFDMTQESSDKRGKENVYISFDPTQLTLLEISSKYGYSIELNSNGLEIIHVSAYGWLPPSFSICFQLNVYNLSDNMIIQMGHYNGNDGNHPYFDTRTITLPIYRVNDFLIPDIHELESHINDLNSEIERLKSELEVAHQNEAHLIEDIDYLYADIDMLTARRGDINDDGQYTVADVVLLARYVAGTIDSIPYYPPE